MTFYYHLARKKGVVFFSMTFKDRKYHPHHSFSPTFPTGRFRPGEYLARQGDVGRELNIVKSGTCAVLRKTGVGFGVVNG